MITAPPYDAYFLQWLYLEGYEITHDDAEKRCHGAELIRRFREAKGY